MNKYKTFIRTILVAAVILAFPYCLFSQEVKIEVHGAPSFSATSISVIDAGLDVSGSIEETVSSTYLNIFSLNPNFANNHDYEVYVSVANLPSNTFLDIKRSSVGTKPGGGGGGQGALDGGAAFLPLSDIPKIFFSGKGDRVNIDLIFRLRGITVAQPTNNLGYQVIFNVRRLL